SRVSELLSSLIQKKILTVREKSNGKTRELAINKDYSQWKTVRKNLNRSGKVEPTVQEKSNPYCPESLDCQGFAESERNILKKYIKENNNNTKADKANFDLVVADNEFISKLQSIFPSVDIQTEIQNMRSWLLVNPPRKDYYRFIQRWIVNAKTKNSQPYQNNDHFEKILKEVRGNKFVGLNDKDYTQGLEGFR
ncbi:MAG: hypothetical protein QMD44_03235, partial [Thermodesulfovibrionales bacterium]|nr:hypothetical protein [Thermodesulfovibrionales bacterium]